MFVDASVIVAILAREAEADALADRLDGEGARITSPIAVFEAHCECAVVAPASDVERGRWVLSNSVGRLRNFVPPHRP